MDDTQKSEIARREEHILTFWNTERIFEKTLEKEAPQGEYVFYDGPPFATGLPHYGHMVPGTIKDAIPRYKTMRGYRVARRFGWDCHGLPLENQIEQELGLKTKRDIESLGTKTFNEAARTAVLRHSDDWRRIIPRLGRWVDMNRSYRTMDTSYSESVWWAFKKLYDKGLVYEGFKAMHLCPRCGTTLSNFEVAQGYKDSEDYAVTVKFRLADDPATSLLVWTTTPWTLPGNVAVAVQADATYVKIKWGSEYIIVAEALKERYPGEVVAVYAGKDLVGKRYVPPFDYFADESLKHKTRAWKAYAGDFVTLEDGTGIVHIAPAFGSDDLALAEAHKIPFIHHVTADGRFTAAVKDFAGLLVKPKGNPKETDEKIIEHLKQKGLVVKADTVRHSYPHCWRCDTPLLNWAAHSWFVKVSAIKRKLVSENAKVRWIPGHVGTGRFNNGLENAPDWAISRSRYWGAPLPVWRNKNTKKLKVIGSIEELLSLQKRSGNRYILMRHGEAESNVKGIVQFDTEGNRLTEKGKEQARDAARALRRERVDLIVCSPLARTRETADIVRRELGLPENAVMQDERLREIDFGAMNGKPIREWDSLFKTFADRFVYTGHGGETYRQVWKRVGVFLFDVEQRYIGKNILVVSHGTPIWFMKQIARRTSYEDMLRLHGMHTTDEARSEYPKAAEWKEVDFIPYPHNDDFDLDLHRPYVDEVTLKDDAGETYERIPDVFDCWFESGSMPFASNHYPFERGAFDPKRFFGAFPRGYPAHFISESLDQTRGWFYSLIVLGVALFGRAPYRTVITNGLVLGEDGRKMSKRLKNYPDMLYIVDRYGADALRYYLLSSPVIRGEDIAFTERGVDEITKKIILRLANVHSFYEMYADGTPRSDESSNVLDRWIVCRLRELATVMTRGFEAYEIDAAVRPVGEFIEDLSTWYLRRSRDRFKGEEKHAALATLRFVLHDLARLMAPITPFYAEHLYRAVRDDASPESVHLASWPQVEKTDAQAIRHMADVRMLVSKALEARNAAGIKVRQPLALLRVKEGIPEDERYLSLIRDEVNVKEVRIDPSLAEPLVLDTALTGALKEEGLRREAVRAIQEKRKAEKLLVSDRPKVVLGACAEVSDALRAHADEIRHVAQLAELSIEERELPEGGFDVRIIT